MPRKYDWVPIDKEIMAGVLSLREIGRKYEIPESTIRKHMKDKGVKRNLSKRVREKVREKLVRTEVRTNNASDDQIVEDAANRGVEVITSMRSDIAALRALEQKLVEELNGEPTKLYLSTYKGEIVQKKVALTASEKAAAHANLAQATHKRIVLQRQAFGLDDDGSVSVDEIMDIIEQASPQLAKAIREKIKNA